MIIVLLLVTRSTRNSFIWCDFTGFRSGGRAGNPRHSRRIRGAFERVAEVATAIDHLVTRGSASSDTLSHEPTKARVVTGKIAR